MTKRGLFTKNSDLLALPRELEELPTWFGEPLGRFLRLKQRNWPAKSVQQSTRQLFLRLSKMTTFFFRHYAWNGWEELSLRWIDDYIDKQLRKGLASSTINWDLINFRVFCRFLRDEGHNPPESILRMKILNTPRRLPRPLSRDQVCQVEECIQTAISRAKTNSQRQTAIRDLACFYLLWHCGLRNSEVCSLLVSELDFSARKLFIRDSKERKDRWVYVSDTTQTVLKKYLATRSNPAAAHLFPTHSGILKTRSLWARLRRYGQRCNVPITAQRLRHTFASQMLGAGMPVTSLQRYLGHELLDTTMIYAEVSDPLLQQDYYRGIVTIDPDSRGVFSEELSLSNREQLSELLGELQEAVPASPRPQEILKEMQSLLDKIEEPTK